MTLKPLNKNVIILPEEQKRETESGILLNEPIKTNAKKGKVLAVSDEVFSVSTGATVVYKPYSVDTIEIEMELEGEMKKVNVAVLDERDVLAVL